MPHHPPFLDRSQLGTMPEAARLDAVREWERLLDAGLIGAPRRPLSDETLATIAHNERVLRAAASYQRQQAFAPYWVPAK